MAKDTKPLALGDTLRDLALLRASGVDLAALVPASSGSAPRTDAESAADEAVARSEAFIQSARMALKVHDAGKVDIVGAKLEGLREGIEDLASQIQKT
ncbi:hypothetical protein CYLTODRAFT_423657 [Cylindrobasidium torrendii FP15055 ss-10]|uniref:Uncharacterized protein n=1 Tax=Cylindrobasidium torrendii FP15055 ss-10 TaxID=1314674 RepID=A0A0D7B6P7_9AGAR|nr:hypothetical protein CYLTODRAFT_423657 [Cylindrobasidium torrendii FP15055 ss-10]